MNTKWVRLFPIWVLSGCITGPTTLPASSTMEQDVVDLAHEYAKEMGTWVEPKFTDEVKTVRVCSDGNPCPAAAWVPNKGRSHTIYFWRPWVNNPTVPEKVRRAKVRHEVEHVKCQCMLGEDPV